MSSFGIDLAAAQALARQELYGDWYRDPWGWPEFQYLDMSTLDVEDLGVRRDRRQGVMLDSRPGFHPIEVPKSRLGFRPAVVIDPLTRLLYLGSGAAVMQSLHDDLPDWVFGWRERDGALSSGGQEWNKYLASLPSQDDTGFALQTDITSCFASISPERVRPMLSARVGKGGGGRCHYAGD